MTLREFMRFHLLKVLLILVVIQITIVAIIQNFNHRPVAQRDQASMIEGRNVKITPLFNDNDKDVDDEIAVKDVSKPLHGLVEQKGNILFYKPANNFVGIDSFAYTISDGRKESKSAYITIQVNKNLAPIANRDIAETYCGSSTIIDVLRNDNDRESDSIFIKGYSQPAHGSVKLFENKLLYSCSASSASMDSFLYTISDGKTNSGSVAAIINVRSKSDPCYPWLSCDIGDAKPGSFSSVNKTLVIEGSGTDIWNNADGCRFTYQYITGNCEIYTKVDSHKGTHQWTKAGIMVRESLNGGSKTAFVCVSGANGATYHQRLTTDAGMEGGEKIPDIKAPYWLKLTRNGNIFNYYISANGNKWQNIGNANVPMDKDVYIGFAVTSHNNNEIAKAVCSNFRVTGKIVNYD